MCDICLEKRNNGQDKVELKLLPSGHQFWHNYTQYVITDDRWTNCVDHLILCVALWPNTRAGNTERMKGSTMVTI